MRSAVVVDGVTLTRAQIEQALVDLNTPEFKGGELVEFNGIRCMVIARGGFVDRAIEYYMTDGERKTGSQEKGVRLVDGRTSYSGVQESSLRRTE